MVQPSTAAVNLTLSAFAAERRAAAACCGVVIGAERRRLLSINSCSRGAQQQPRRTPLLRSIDGTDERADRQTDGHPAVTYTLLRILYGQCQ